MNLRWKEYLVNADCRAGATAEEVEVLTRQFPSIREDYIAFLRECNGAEGRIGKRYVALWSVSDLIELNEAYAVSEFAPGLLLIGTDGSNEGFGFDCRSENRAVVQIPLVGMDWGEAKTVASDFVGFLRYLGSANDA